MAELTGTEVLSGAGYRDITPTPEDRQLSESPPCAGIFLSKGKMGVVDEADRRLIGEGGANNCRHS